jgi:hypothetical protein
VIGLVSPDPVLSFLGCLGLGVAAGTALVVDRLGDIETSRSLADLIDDGPSSIELTPGRRGVALIGDGGVSLTEADEVIFALASVWPAVVVRSVPGGWEGRLIPFRPLLPGILAPRDPQPAVWQSCGSGVRAPGPGPILPKPSSRLVSALLRGRLPVRSRWLRAWRDVWEMPWA